MVKTNQVHGHEIMKMMIEEDKLFTESELKNAILTKFGPETRFHTCSAENMTSEQLIDVLKKKGKFIVSEKGIKINKNMICNH
jgi:probable metal-binding protein